MMRIDTELPGVVILEPHVFEDARGYFFESWNAKTLAELGIQAQFVQDNESFSQYGVIRGLHFQRGTAAQAKLVRVIEGEVLDVAVDVRAGSNTFGRHVAVRLSGTNHRQLFIPRGFAHGFAVLSPTARFAYKCDNFYAPEADGGVLATDPALGIDWGIPIEKRIFSIKDEHAASWADYCANPAFHMNDKGDIA